MDTPWGWEAGAQAEVLGDPPSWQRYARAHLWRDPQQAGQRSGYRFPVARMVDGELQLVFRGAAAVVGALQRSGKHESLEGVSLEDQKQMYMVKISINFIALTKKKIWEIKLSTPENYGTLSLIVKLKPVILICFIKMLVIY